MFGLTDRGNKIKVNLVWVMFWYCWTYMVAIGKKLQTNEKLKRWLTNPNIQELQRDYHHKHDHLWKTNIW